MANFNKAKKLHFIYKTTNLINGRYYVGIHSTNNLKDGYLGSGKQLRAAVKKYGEENFQVEILEYLPARSSLVSREKEIVNETLLKDPQCMNLKEGGEGGFISVEQQHRRAIAGGKAFANKIKNDLEFAKFWSEQTSKRNKRRHKENTLDGTFYDWTGKNHKQESKLKISTSKKGKCIGNDNSQFGTCWITNGEQNKKIKKTETIPNGWKLGRSIKNIGNE